MQEIPARSVASAALAPVILVGGWSLAAMRQPHGYDPVRDTLSALAGRGASDRWLMTSALAGLGACHLVTASGLSSASTAGRIVLATGGIATLFVAGIPLPAEGSSPAHATAAAASFLALGAWPVFAARRPPSNLTLRVDVSAGATVVLLGLVAWFVTELRGTRSGLAERVAAGAQALWPLLVVAASRKRGRAVRLAVEAEAAGGFARLSSVS